jgi:YVTN family beta-propeller protein
MNILQCLLVISALASLFVSGPNMAPVQSEAASPSAAGGDKDDYKITKDYKERIQKDVNVKSSKTNQHLGQDNLCYKDDDCEEATEGEQIKGKDNVASGFNEQSKNTQQQPVVFTPTTPGIPGNGTTSIPTPTPTPTTSTLTVTKHVVCDFTSVACPTANQFNINATTSNGSSYSFSGSETGTPLRINPPFPVTYQITETSPTSGDIEFATTTAGDCSGTISSGQHLTCTITNTARLVTANLNVCKEVVDSSDRRLQPSNFTFTFSTPANPSTFEGDDECTAVTVAPGQYEFSEARPAGTDFTTTISGDCSLSTRDSFIGNITAGQTETCTVTNTVTPPSTLTVTKHVVCGFTSTTVACPTANQFNINATTSNGSSYTFSGSESGTPLMINPPFPVTYQITETSPTQGFVVSTIPVQSAPNGIVFNPNNGDLYVTNYGSNTVSVIDGTTNTVVTTIPVGTNPRDLAFNPNNGDLYVTNQNSNTVSVIDGTTNTVVTTIPVGPQPFGVAFNPDNGNMYVTNYGSNTVSVIDGTTNTVIGTISVGSGPIYIAFNPDNGDIYVTNQFGSSVSVIDTSTNTVVVTIPVGSFPGGIAFNEDNGDMYVANGGSNTVSVIDGATNTVVATIPAGMQPFGVAFNPDNGDMYVTNANSNTVSVIDGATNTVVDTIPVGDVPFGIAFNPTNGFMYVTNQNDDTVSVIAPLTTTFSEECSGTINSGGQTATCTVTNAYGRPA